MERFLMGYLAKMLHDMEMKVVSMEVRLNSMEDRLKQINNDIRKILEQQSGKRRWLP